MRQQCGMRPGVKACKATSAQCCVGGSAPAWQSRGRKEPQRGHIFLTEAIWATPLFQRHSGDGAGAAPAQRGAPQRVPVLVSPPHDLPLAGLGMHSVGTRASSALRKGSRAGKWVRVTVTPEALAEVLGSSQASTARRRGEEAPNPKSRHPTQPRGADPYPKRC